MNENCTVILLTFRTRSVLESQKHDTRSREMTSLFSKKKKKKERNKRKRTKLCQFEKIVEEKFVNKKAKRKEK